MISRYRLRRRRAELDAAVARKMRLRRIRRTMTPVAEMIPPFVISGVNILEGFDPTNLVNPFITVYTSSWYHEAPTVVNTMDAWNVLRSQSVNFPLFWNRMY